ncbi:MAG: L-lactate dehydrogenase [Clostridia bacterium]|nr:L-lactate dehydrogenase [Clostridia bacterium]
MVERRKIVLVGTGFVGMSMAYSLLNQGGVNELVLIDVVKEKAEGEAMDLSHGMPFAPTKMDIKAGDYSDCKDANIVVITAGLNQKPGQTRLELAKANAKIMKDITKQVVASGFKGIFVVASNPVDLMTYVVYKTSGFPKEKVIGSGTVLDTARLRFLIGEYLEVASKNVHAYIMGEHGDSSFVPWNHCYVGCKKLIDVMKETGKDLSDLDKIYTDVQQAAYEIINKKKATYYGIGIALTRLIKAILGDQNAIMPVSMYQDGEYGHSGMFIGVPAIINRKGIKEMVKLNLDAEDQEKFDHSCELLSQIIKDQIDEIIEND